VSEIEELRKEVEELSIYRVPLKPLCICAKRIIDKNGKEIPGAKVEFRLEWGAIVEGELLMLEPEQWTQIVTDEPGIFSYSEILESEEMERE
jgi:hypothetical protein